MPRNNLNSRHVRVSVVDPVHEALTALNNGVVELDINMTGEGKTDAALGAKSDYPQLGNRGCKHIAAALQSNTTCKVLDLRGNRIGGGSAVCKLARVLAADTTLERLDLSCNSITSTDLRYLGRALKRNNSLTKLALNSNKIKDAGVVFLAECLKTNRSLTALHLCHNCIRDDGAEALARLLSKNSQLGTLTLISTV